MGAVCEERMSEGWWQDVKQGQDKFLVQNLGLGTGADVLRQMLPGLQLCFWR